MGKSRKDNPEYYQGRDINGNKTWKRFNSAKRTTNVIIGNYGFSAADDFLTNSAKMPINLSNDPQTEEQRNNVLQLINSMNNMLKGKDSPYHPDNISQSNNPEELQEQYQELSHDFYSELELLNNDHKEKVKELYAELDHLQEQPVHGTNEDRAVSVEKTKIKNKITQLENNYVYDKNALVSSYSDVTSLMPDMREEYARSTMQGLLNNDAIVHTIMHDPDSFNTFYDQYVSHENKGGGDLGNVMRDEINKNFMSRYGMTFESSEENGIYVPKIHNQGDDFSQHLQKAKHAELLQEWSGTQNQGVYWGENYIKSGDITSSIIRERRMRTIRIAARIALFKYAQHRMNRRIYGRNYRPYIRYRDELRKFQRDVDRELRKTEIKDTYDDNDDI